jgi:translocation and assembly module TamB
LAGWRAESSLSPLDDTWSQWQLKDSQLTDPLHLVWEQPEPARLSISGDTFSISSFNIRESAQSLNFSFANGPDHQEGALTLENFSLAALLSWDALPARPNLSMQASWQNGASGFTFSGQGRAEANQEEELAAIDFTASGTRARWQLSARAHTPEAVLAEISLSFDPAAPAASLQAALKSRQAPLRPWQAFIPYISELEGTLDLDIEAGPNRQGIFMAQGYAQLSDAEFVLERVNQHYSDLDMRRLCREDGLWIENFQMNSGSGRIWLKGSAGWPGGQEALQLDLAAENFNLDLSPWGALLLDGRLSLGGVYSRPILKGEISGKSAQMKIFHSAAAGLDDIVMQHSGQPAPELRFADEREPVFSLPPFLDNWEMDLSLGLAKNFRVTISEGWCALSGSARLHKEAGGSPLISGSYKIERGLLVILSTRIEQIHGGIAFKDPAALVPELNLSASVRYELTDISLRVSGSALAPRVNIDSDPPMSQTDILSLLAFGRPLRELNQQEGSSLSNQALALAMIGEQGRKELRHVLGSTLTPDVITTHNEIQQGTSLEAGKYLRDDLYLRYRQGTDEESDFQNLGLEWRLSSHITLQGQVGTKQDSGVDIFFHFAFGGQPPAEPGSQIEPLP